MNPSFIFLLIVKFIIIECGPLNKIKGWKRIAEPDLRIIHGQPVMKGEQPSIVSIQEEEVHICGGNIINEDTILTAAHCIINSNTSLWVAVAGTINLDDTFTSDVQRVEIESVMTHPNFTWHSSLYDIAIIRLKTKFMFTSYVNSTSLHNTSDIPEHGEIFGWGVTESGDKSNLLLKTDIKIETEEHCLEELGDDIVGLICAQTSPGDACHGDSGGPLICDSNELCGIISSGKDCGSESGSALYTDVSYFSEWIVSNAG